MERNYLRLLLLFLNQPDEARRNGFNPDNN